MGNDSCLVYIRVGSHIDFCTFISASLEILYCVATGWDQYVDLTCQNLEVLAHFYWCDFVTYLSDSATIIYVMIRDFYPNNAIYFSLPQHCSPELLLSV